MQNVSLLLLVSLIVVLLLVTLYLVIRPTNKPKKRKKPVPAKSTPPRAVTMAVVRKKTAHLNATLPRRFTPLLILLCREFTTNKEQQIKVITQMLRR